MWCMHQVKYIIYISIEYVPGSLKSPIKVTQATKVSFPIG